MDNIVLKELHVLLDSFVNFLARGLIIALQVIIVRQIQPTFIVVQLVLHVEVMFHVLLVIIVLVQVHQQLYVQLVIIVHKEVLTIQYVQVGFIVLLVHHVL